MKKSSSSCRRRKDDEINRINCSYELRCLLQSMKRRERESARERKNDLFQFYQEQRERVTYSLVRHFVPNDIRIHLIMSAKSSISSGLQKAFDKYSKFGKTQAQLNDHNGIRIGSAGIQKMMKDCSLIDTKYTSQLLDNDLARVLGKLTTGSNGPGSIHYPKGT